MSNVRTFRAYRPNREEVEDIASPPYDVLNREEAGELVENNPVSFLHVVKAEVDLPDNIDLYEERVYRKSKENLDKLIKEGHLIQEKEPCFYLYTQKKNNHVQNGLVALASVNEYDNGKIKVHESTRKDKERDRTKHIYTLNAQTGPVFLSYREGDNTQDMSDIFNKVKKNEPLYKFSGSDNVVHTVWRINREEDIESIKSTMSNLEYLYIADGHHRSKAASLVREIKMNENPNHTGEEEYNFFLTVIFPHTELKILAYNRVVKDLNGLSDEEFLEKISDNFSVEKVNERYEPEARHHFGLYLNGVWYHMRAREGKYPENDEVRSIDASILQENLLSPVLSIEKPKQSERIDFVGGIKGLKGLEDLVNSGGFVAAFALYPTSMEELMRVADANRNMPPKSTWFEPKLKSGLFVHKI